MPDEPPCTSKLSPAAEPRRGTKTLLQTVKKVSQSAGRLDHVRAPRGTGSAWSWWVSAYSA